MTLLQMSYILEVDRCGSMNRAARNLFLSQSALSAAIAEVERELGVTIFLRTNRGVTLTEEGRELTAQIAPLVERSRKLERYYSERRAADRVSLSVASQRYPFCAKAFVEFLHLLDEPHIQVSFKEMEMAAVIDEVTARRSAFGIIFVSDMTEHFIGPHPAGEEPDVPAFGGHPPPGVSAEGPPPVRRTRRAAGAAVCLPLRGIYPVGQQLPLRRGGRWWAPARSLTG